MLVPPALPRSRSLLVVAVAVLATACSGSDLAGSGRPSGRSYGTEAWYEASFGASPTEVVLRFEGPDGPAGDECEPDREVAVDVDDREVTATVKRYSPSPVVVCPTSPQTITATLPEPLGDRPLVNPETGWRFRPDGDRLVLDPDSTPCGRADCSTPAVAEASCTPLEYAAVIDEQIGPGQAIDQDVRCDGSFLVLTRDGRRSWFVNRTGAWQLVTNRHSTCDDVWNAFRIRFPAALCR